MTMPTNPSDWKTFDELAEGIGENRLPGSSALAGERLSVALGGNTTLTLQFGQDGGFVSWSQSDALAGQDRVEVVEVAEDTYFIDFWMQSADPRSSRTVIADLTKGTVLTALCTVSDHPIAGEPRVAQAFAPGRLVGVEREGHAAAPTRDLIGKRIFNYYGPNHAYEHIYLNSSRYCWQCLSGVQRGHGDCDLASYWRFGDGRYIFAFREFRIPVAALFFFNFDTWRSMGKFIGIEGDGAINNSYASARLQVLSETGYPDGVQPA